MKRPGVCLDISWKKSDKDRVNSIIYGLNEYTFESEKGH